MIYVLEEPLPKTQVDELQVGDRPKILVMG